MLDGIGENISFTLAVFLRILLGTEYDSLASMHSVNPIYNLVEPLHFLELFGIDVKEVLLDWRVGTDAHNDDSGLLVLIAFAVDLAQGLVCDLGNSNG